MALSVALALFGALLFAVSAALQQHSARSTARRLALDAGLVRPPIRGLLVRLTREPLWWFGWLAGVAGFGAQAVALHLGSIVVVQALVVAQLPFALPLNSVFTGRRPLRRDWGGAVAVCAGLILLVVVRGGVRQGAGQRAGTWLVAAAASGLILLLLLAARLLRSHAQSRTLALAVAAGICFCVTAVFLVFAGDDVSRRGLAAAVFGRPAAGLCVSTVVGMILVQHAFAGGSLPTALTAMTITDPLASWVAVVLVFGARPAMNPRTLWACAAAAVLIAAGVAALATSPTLRDRGLPDG